MLWKLATNRGLAVHLGQQAATKAKHIKREIDLNHFGDSRSFEAGSGKILSNIENAMHVRMRACLHIWIEQLFSFAEGVQLRMRTHIRNAYI